MKNGLNEINEKVIEDFICECLEVKSYCCHVKGCHSDFFLSSLMRSRCNSYIEDAMVLYYVVKEKPTTLNLDTLIKVFTDKVYYYAKQRMDDRVLNLEKTVYGPHISERAILVNHVYINKYSAKLAVEYESIFDTYCRSDEIQVSHLPFPLLLLLLSHGYLDYLNSSEYVNPNPVRFDFDGNYADIEDNDKFVLNFDLLSSIKADSNYLFSENLVHYINGFIDETGAKTGVKDFESKD